MKPFGKLIPAPVYRPRPIAKRKPEWSCISCSWRLSEEENCPECGVMMKRIGGR